MRKLQAIITILLKQIKDFGIPVWKRKLDENRWSACWVFPAFYSQLFHWDGDGKQYSPWLCGGKQGCTPQYSTEVDDIVRDYKRQQKSRTLLVQCGQGIHTKTGTPVLQVGRLGQEFCVGKATLSSPVPLANKLARIAWALTARQQTYVA